MFFVIWRVPSSCFFQLRTRLQSLDLPARLMPPTLHRTQGGCYNRSLCFSSLKGARDSLGGSLVSVIRVGGIRTYVLVSFLRPCTGPGPCLILAFWVAEKGMTTVLLRWSSCCQPWRDVDDGVFCELAISPRSAPIVLRTQKLGMMFAVLKRVTVVIPL